ncbi:MAG: helix-hairpin-helix domain-containing protein [Methanosarcinaceae archaeon]|nr:helix-hairpin-helix domain-containing protein [Methanosarcinaceae archaeon]
MKLVNPTKKMISVGIPITVGKYNRPSLRWIHVESGNDVEIDDKDAWRGENHGLVSSSKYKLPVTEQITSDFTVLKGIDSELDGILATKYETIVNMKIKANKEDLVAISGIGHKRADNILKQLKNL